MWMDIWTRMNKIIHKFQCTIIHRNDDLWTGQKSKVSLLEMWSDELCNRSGRPSRQKDSNRRNEQAGFDENTCQKNQLSVNLRMEVLWSAQVNDAELDVMYNCIAHRCFFLFSGILLSNCSTLKGWNLPVNVPLGSTASHFSCNSILLSTSYKSGDLELMTLWVCGLWTMEDSQDLLLVLEDGKISSMGSYEELQRSSATLKASGTSQANIGGFRNNRRFRSRLKHLCCCPLGSISY